MNTANYFKIGMFILIGTALVVGGILALGAGSYFQVPQRMETYIDESVQGLSIGSPVKHRGVEIGTVSQIGFVRNEYLAEKEPTTTFDLGRSVLVRWDVKPSVLQGRSEEEAREMIQTAVEQGLRVQLTSQGITGLAFLDMNWFDPQEHPLPDIQWEPKTIYIPSTQSTFEQIFATVVRVLEDIDAAELDVIGKRIQALLGTLDRQVGGVDFTKLDREATSLLQELRATTSKVNDTLDSETISKAFEDGAASLRTIHEMLKRSDEDIRKTLENLRKFSADMAVASAEVPEAVRRLNRDLQQIHRVIADNENELTTLLENLTEASRDLRVLLGNAREYPSQVFFGEPPPKKKVEAKP